MPRLLFTITATLVTLWAAITLVKADECFGCPNSDYDHQSNGEAEFWAYWTCDESAGTFTCYYPSAEDPGTYNYCTYAGLPTSDDGVLLSGSEYCDSYAGVSKTCAGSGDVFRSVSPYTCVAASSS